MTSAMTPEKLKLFKDKRLKLPIDNVSIEVGVMSEAFSELSV